MSLDLFRSCSVCIHDETLLAGASGPGGGLRVPRERERKQERERKEDMEREREREEFSVAFVFFISLLIRTKYMPIDCYHKLLHDAC